MKNLILLHQWDYDQWDFLFGTDGKIFSQKEFFIHYSRTYIEYSFEKTKDSIFSEYQQKPFSQYWIFSEFPSTVNRDIYQYIPENGKILVISEKEISGLESIDSTRIHYHGLRDSDLLAQVEGEWLNIKKTIQEVSPALIIASLGLSRIILLSRIKWYGWDFLDVSYQKREKQDTAHAQKFRKILRWHLLRLGLYSFALKSLQLVWKIFKR